MLTITNTPSFLHGGGEMGLLTRTYDWALTPIGPPETWPLSLRTTVGIVLHSAFPMFLFWGDDQICFYNDAYRPSLGRSGKHPAVGQTAKTVWPEIWNFLGPHLLRVKATGEAVWFEDQLVPIFRNGRLDDVYWTFSYSPAFDDDGQIGGVLVTCTETTAKIQATNKLRASEQLLQNIVRDASVGMIVLEGEAMRVDMVNETYANLINRQCNELLGKPLFSVIPDAEATFRPIIDNVRLTGKPTYLYGQPYFVRNADGIPVTGSLNLIYQPYRQQDGTITGVVVQCQDVTAQQKAEDARRASDAKLRSVVEAAPVAMSLFMGRDLVIELPNRTFIDMAGKGPDIVGRPLREVMPTFITGSQTILQLLDDSYTSGKAFQQHGMRVEVEEQGVMTRHYYDSTYTPLINEAGDVYAILGIAVDVTRQVKSQQHIEESEAFTHSVFYNTPIAHMVLLGKEMTIKTVNENLVAIAGRDAADLIGNTFIGAMPELGTTPLMNRLQHVYATGETYYQSEEEILLMRHGQPHTGFYNYIYKAFRDAGGLIYGIIIAVFEVTEQVLARQELEKQRAFLQNAIDIADLGTFEVDLTTDIGYYTDNVGLWFGVSNDSESMPVIMSKIHPDDLPAVQQGLDDTMQSEDHSHHDLTYRIMVESGQGMQYLRSIGKTQFTDGQPVRISGIIQDVTPQVLARQKIEAAEMTLRGAINLAELGTWELDLATQTTTYSDRIKEWLGLADNTESGDGIYRPVHPSDLDRVRKAVEEASLPGSAGVYNEEYTVINQKTGQQRVLHAQGITLVDVNGKPLKISGTVQDVTKERQVQQELERLVQQRTKLLQESVEDLERSNENLKQFAYVASHDLQEPLRKIQSFGNILLNQFSPQLGDGVDYLHRMQASGDRMSTLISDLLSYSRISTRQEDSTRVCLPDVLRMVLTDLELHIAESGAQLTVGQLPTVLGDRSQLAQLFQNLISNALKFSQADTSGTSVVPQIWVSSQPLAAADLPAWVKPARSAPTYHQIDVRDNGIGFDEKYRDRIFQVFQRLHGRNAFAGTGIGLAICEKVATNHGGAITARSRPGQGAIFSVYLPIA